MFTQTVLQVAKLFIFMLIGYILTKADIMPKEAPKVLSKLLVWVASPALYLKTFSTQFTPEKLSSYLSIIAVAIVSLAVTFSLAKLLERFISTDEYLRNVFTYSVCIPNSGYIGNVLVLALYGEAMLLKFQIFIIPNIIFTVTVGYAMLLQRKPGLKSSVNPLMVSAIIGIILGLLRVRIPDFAVNILTSASDFIGPISMILTGCVIAQFDLRKILSQKEVYITVFFRMIAMPLLTVAVGKLFHLPSELFFLLLALNCLPAGLNSVVYPSTIGKDCSIGAGIATVSNILAVITVPFFFSLL